MTEAIIHAVGEGHSVEYTIEGTEEEITAAVGHIYGNFPTPGYGTFFNWPPGQLIAIGDLKGQPLTYLAPREVGDGRWVARGHRSISCD